MHPQAASFPPPAAQLFAPRRNPMLFLYPVLDSLNTGGFIRKVVATAIQIAGAFFLLTGLIACFGVLAGAFRGEQPAKVMFGLVLFALILLAGLAAVAQVFWYRASAIKSIDNSSGFVIMPIVSQLFRMTGEIYATLAVCIGIGGCLAMWFADINPLGMLGGFGPSLMMGPMGGSSFGGGGGSGGFMAGLTLAVMGCLGGFAMLVVFYFLAELSVVTASIARDMRALAAKVGA
jgi:hypothetical protein